MAVAGEHPVPGHQHLQRLPHPPPVGPYSCTHCFGGQSGWPAAVSGTLLFGLGGPAGLSGSRGLAG